MTERKLDGIKACVFDAYGTLFDINAAAQHCAQELGDKWQPLADMWRLRQLQYSWLRGLMREYVSFWQITEDALDFAMEGVGLADDGLRQRLLDLYMQLDTYEEVAGVLSALKAKGLKTAILSNGSPDMLQSAVDNAGIAGDLDAVLSVHELKTYKTAPEVYQLAVDRMGVGAGEISFQSSNAWDAHAASNFGMRVVWVNRFGQPRERLPGAPDIELTSLHGLPDIVA